MKPMRGLLVAAALLAVLSGLVYWSKKHKEDAAKTPLVDAAPKILTLDDKQVDEVKIAKTGVDPVVLSKLGDKWEITKPEPMAADQDTASSIVTTAASLVSDKLIEDKPADLAPFGLAAPSSEVTLHLKNGKSSTLAFGNATPSGSAVYVKLASDPRVFSVGSTTRTNIDKSLSDLRDKRLLTFNSDKLSRLELTGKGPPIEFGKTGQNEWQILKPEPMRADPLQVDELVRKLKESKILLDAGKVANATFLAAPKLAAISVTDNSGTQTAEIRQDKDKNTYAKSSVVDGIYKINADVSDTLTKSLNDFRNKKLFDFGFTELSQLTAQGVTYTKTGEKWFTNGKEMDASSITNLIDKLRDLSSTSFVTKGGGAPLFDASIVTQDKKRTEKVSIRREGSTTFGQREGEPAVYVLDNSAADDLTKAAAAIKPVTPAKSSGAPSKK